MRSAVALAGLVLFLALPAPSLAGPLEYTDNFDLVSCTFSSTGRNAHFTIEPGDFFELEGMDEGETVNLEIEVLSETETIDFATEDGTMLAVEARVVVERERADDELVEISRNFFARCIETGAIYYFGEEVDIYEDGEVTSHAGAWRAGVDGARPGLIMPGTFLVGSRYFQEIAPGVALDRAEHIAHELNLATAAGKFQNCVEVRETTPLEPGAESIKRYCPWIGLVFDDGVELVAYELQDDGDGDGEDEDEEDDGEDEADGNGSDRGPSGVLFSVGQTAGVQHAGGHITLRPENVYRYDPDQKVIEIVLDADALDLELGNVNAVAWLAEGRIAISVDRQRGVHHAGGYTVLRPQNVYAVDPATGTIELVVDLQSVGLRDLDAVDLSESAAADSPGSPAAQAYPNAARRSSGAAAGRLGSIR